MNFYDVSRQLFAASIAVKIRNAFKDRDRAQLSRGEIDTRDLISSWSRWLNSFGAEQFPPSLSNRI